VTNATHCGEIKLNEFICQKSYIDPALLLNTGASGTIITIIIVIVLILLVVAVVGFLALKKKRANKYSIEKVPSETPIGSPKGSTIIDDLELVMEPKKSKKREKSPLTKNLN